MFLYRRQAGPVRGSDIGVELTISLERVVFSGEPHRSSSWWHLWEM
ncbi:MAG: hypothetical protein KJ958_11465 [Gammaproteobacteria bacterium]|nr:hypothetical protein [Gammaproteobacteria bacterium]MBU1979771.1 hypothetical protein [Gammaproteobacteria bacterium]